MSSMMFNKLVAIGVGDQLVVFVAHRMGGLVVKQMLFQAENRDSQQDLMKNIESSEIWIIPLGGEIYFAFENKYISQEGCMELLIKTEEFREPEPEP